MEMRPGLDSDLDLAAAARTAPAASERAASCSVDHDREAPARARPGRIASESHSGPAGMGGSAGSLPVRLATFRNLGS